MALIDVKNVTLALGGPSVLDGVNLRIEKGERICLLGRNGEGKSTLLRLLAGTIQPDAGEIIRRNGLRVGRLTQELPAGLSGTVSEVVAGGFALADLPQPDWEDGHIVERTLTRAGLDPAADFTTLSTGNKRRVLLARAMVIGPDILLLDEPTNHLDIDAIKGLEEDLRRFAGTLVFVTHDRAFLRGLAQRIVELDRGRLRDWTCDYDTFLRRRDEALRVEQEQNAEFDRKLAEEEIWIRQGVRERRTRNEGRVRELKRMRTERHARRETAGTARISLQDAARSGKLVVRVRDLGFSWDDKIMARGFSALIQRGDRIGILGPNGSGKTTLLRLLLGNLQPSSGSVELGSNLQVAYFDQQRDQLDESKTVLENVTDGNDRVQFGGRSIHAITYLKNFLFTADRARAPISHLSGGERNRLLLARLFTRPANLLVLDEPTNDLDLETVDLLEELVAQFDGTLILVSHDRDFLDNVTTSTLVLEGGGRITETVGGYSDWARASRNTKTESGKTKQRNKKESFVSSPTPGPDDQPRRRTWKEGRELESLPARIEELEARQTELHALMADPEFYQEKGDRVASAKVDLETVERELAQSYVRWEELEGLDS
ncbi:MAG: ATP-binding cassette domain-containing protein [Candidatus Krumholzibacteriota bacterium]